MGFQSGVGYRSVDDSRGSEAGGAEKHRSVDWRRSGAGRSEGYPTTRAQGESGRAEARRSFEFWVRVSYGARGTERRGPRKFVDGYEALDEYHRTAA